MINIAVHGVPRSGTSWLGAIFDSSENVAYRHQPLFAYAFKSFLHEQSSRADIRRFFKLLSETGDDFILQKPGKQTGSIPTFAKKQITHVIYKEARYHNILRNMLRKDPDIRVVGIVRNPKSVISSWHKAPKEFKKGEWSLQDQWRQADLKNQGRPEEFYGFDKWKEVAELFLELKATFPDRFYLLTYEDLLKNTEPEVKRLFEFCGLAFGPQTQKFLMDSRQVDRSDDAYSVFRKGQTDQKWGDDLPKSICDSIDQELAGTDLEQFNR